MAQSNISQPTVLVKKADGSFVRLTLDEVKKMKTQEKKTPQAPTSMAQSETPAETQAAAAKPTTNNSKRFDRAFGSHDFSSLLEEDLPESALAPRVSDSRSSAAEEVVRKSRVAVAPDVRNRLLTIVQLFLKEVRTLEQTRGALTRPALEGGVGLEQTAVDTILKIAAEEIEKSAKKISASDVPTINTLKASVNLEDELPMKYKAAGAVAVASPNNSFVHAPTDPKPSKPERDRKPLATPRGMPAEKNMSPVTAGTHSEPFSLQSSTAAKVTMHDVLPPAAEMGPVDEIRSIALVDFRRLAPTPTEAAARLKQKFVNLRDESILLALEARTAWRESPLFHDYMSTVAEALANRRPLGTAQNGSAITLQEIEALAKMNEEI